MRVNPDFNWYSLQQWVFDTSLQKIANIIPTAAVKQSAKVLGPLVNLRLQILLKGCIYTGVINIADGRTQAFGEELTRLSLAQWKHFEEGAWKGPRVIYLTGSTVRVIVPPSVLLLAQRYLERIQHVEKIFVPSKDGPLIFVHVGKFGPTGFTKTIQHRTVWRSFL